MKVILINPEMGHGPSHRLIGKSGKCYGNSRWSNQHRCHIVEMTLEEFQKASDDLWRASNMVMRRWWPTFSATVPQPVAEFWKGYELAMDGKGLPDNSAPAVSLGWGFVQAQTHELSEEEEPMPTVMDLRARITAEISGLKWFAACKLARTKYGIDTHGLYKIGSLIDTIVTKLGHEQQPAAN